VDTRPGDNYDNGHIEGSRHIDLEDIHEAEHLLPRDKKIVLIDHKGKQTLVIGRYLASKGYTDVARLDGGFNAWAKTRYPIAVSGKGGR
jgi:rhodanese-related sulfurtransferase